jgi:hypothetical protein
MATLRDLTELFGASLSPDIVKKRVWPEGALIVDGALSLRATLDRFGEAAQQLRIFRRGSTPSAWKSAERTFVADGLRDRVLDPAIIRQVDTPLCGPLAVAFSFARRDPVGYIRTITDLFDHGSAAAPNGHYIRPDDDLLGGALPSGELNQADWIFGAALRDDENWFWDVEGEEVKGGLSGGITTSYEMGAWTRDLLQLPTRLIPDTWPGPIAIFGEIKMLRAAAAAVLAGGEAFLCINATLLRNGKGDDEENMGWKLTEHATQGRTGPGNFTHSQDDGLLPDHWIVLLGDYVEQGEHVSLKVWSWGGNMSCQARWTAWRNICSASSSETRIEPDSPRVG